MYDYDVPQSVVDDIKNRFTYHAPQGSFQTDRYTDIRNWALEFANFLTESCPPSRELSLAITKLEECVMWANASIARNE